MPQDNLAELTDIALRLKEAFEDRDIKALQTMLHRAQLNIMGRFIPVQEFLAKLQELFAVIEQPALDIVRVSETDVGANRGLVSYVVEVSWVDRHAWEERLFPGLMTLELKVESEGAVEPGSVTSPLKKVEPRAERKGERADKPYAGDDRRRWIITGLTFARRHEEAPDAGEPEQPPPGAPTAPRPFDLFGFWY